MLIIEITSEKIKSSEFPFKETKGRNNKGDIGLIFKQPMLVHGSYIDGFQTTQGRDGVLLLKIVNTEIDKNPVVIPYKKGFYAVSSEGFYWDNSNLKLFNTQLQPLDEYIEEMTEQFKKLSINSDGVCLKND
jgi:hypothetical protein